MLTQDESLEMAAFPIPNLHLPSVTEFYLRKLIHQNLDRLTTLDGASPPPFNQLTLSEPALVSHTRSFEQLILQHQTLDSQGAKHRPDLRRTEQEIFRLLGLKLQPQAPRATLLLVDDTAELLRLLSTALSNQGYEVCSATSGALALNRAAQIQPDLILLDIMMPGIDGYEVCERLKADPNTCTIPIIFITAVDDVLDKVKAFGMGGADYVTKPFQIEEVFSRIEHQLNIRDLQHRLVEQNRRLQTEVSARQQAENRYRQLFDSAHIGLYQATLDGRFLSANSALATLYGYASVAELLQISSIAEALYVRPQRRAEYIAYLNQYATLEHFESEVYRQDGSTLWISENAHAVKDDQGNLLFYEGLVQDITGRRPFVYQTDGLEA
jgi:PAS domain S-box-containing protein